MDKDWDLPENYLHRARQLRDKLLNVNHPLVLLHGDLHQDNILSHQDGWLVIDPKGVIGFPINEVWACVENPQYDLEYISKYFNYPFDEVVGWYFVHLILAACWQLEDHLDPAKFMDLAHSVEHLIPL